MGVFFAFFRLDIIEKCFYNYRITIVIHYVIEVIHLALLKCKMCGGDIELSADKTFGTCEFCGSTMTFPKVDDDQRAAAFNRGNHFRRIGEFDKALAVYERIVREDESDAEAHWCCALCRFGIEYVEDPATFEWLPTCHRASFDSFLEDVDYLAAVEHSEGITRRQYQKDAAKIAEVQRGILATSQSADPYDVFICYKESDENGERTRDSLMAQDVYYQLTDQGYRVFFARITLEDLAGSQYEPYIFAALNSAKVMIVVGTKPEYLNAVWVKNEWSRFLAMMKKDRHKLLLPCYRDMDPYDMPEQLSVLQSYDMGKIGFIQDLIRGIKKVLDAEKKPEIAPEPVVVQQAATSTAPLLKRAFMFLEDGDWNSANEYCEKVLDIEPENAQAYLGNLMAELKVKKQDDLKNCAEPFDGRSNYQKAVRFADADLKAALTGAVAYIKERNENNRLEGIYTAAKTQMARAITERAFKDAAKIFDSVAKYKDSAALAQTCREKAEEARKDIILSEGKSKMSGKVISNYESAIKLFESISGWKDADECLAQSVKRKAELEELAAEERKEAERIAKRNKKIAIITTPIVCAFIAFIIVLNIVLNTVIIPNGKYNEAIALMEAGEYKEAILVFDALDGYKDSTEKMRECNYDYAVTLMDAGNLDEAYSIFMELGDYKDVADKAVDIRLQITKEQLKSIKIGDYVTFGAYEQDNNNSNGKEDVEWLVLEVKDGKALVISKYALDCKPYNTTYTGVTWENCTLRKWLNNDFINAAFSADEKAMISTVTVSADKNPEYSTNPGNATQDQLFLLSITEANKYFNSDSARKCKPTDYAVESGAYVNSSKGNCRWWLRSPGEHQYMAVDVRSDGFVYKGGYDVYYDDDAVRPALWIDLTLIE